MSIVLILFGVLWCAALAVVLQIAWHHQSEIDAIPQRWKRRAALVIVSPWIACVLFGIVVIEALVALAAELREEAGDVVQRFREVWRK